ncbi:MAG TPA: rod shape-determining protein MreD [Acidimicrobiales bacterium]|nr:rod shape-determining protein MreD [Acidimicrobiales bacterium]|tara:strand:- start:629 stop:1147 length:519 start_codon:yes stop_codon:yes gene_type:complete
MTTRIRSFVVLVTAALLQATIFSEFRFLGASAEILLLVTVLAGYHGGPDHGAIFGFFASLLQDALTGAPFGLHAMVYSPLAVGVSSLEDRLVESRPIVYGIGLVLAVIIGTSLAGFTGLLFGQTAITNVLLIKKSIIAGLTTAIVAAPINKSIQWSLSMSNPGVVELRIPEK